MPVVQPWKPGALYKCLVFGMYKVGKTAGAGTFPRPNFIDCDRGVATLGSKWWRERWPDNPPAMFEQFKEQSIDKKTGVVIGHNAFDDACRYFDACMSPKAVKWRSTSDGQTYEVSAEMFDTWVVDSLTTLSEFAMNKALVLLGDKAFSATSNTLSQAKTHGMVFPKIQDYGSERSLVEQFIDMIRDSGKNVVILAHTKEITSSTGMVTDIVPLITGKGVQAISCKFDEIYQVRVKPEGTDRKRVLTTQSNGIIKVGTRYGLPNDTEWNYSEITKALTTLT